MAYLDASNLSAAFLDDDALRARKLERRHIGQLQVTSGRIVACDPLVQPERPAFTRALAAPGAHPVELLVDGSGDHALAVLWVRDRARIAPDALRWEMATLPDADVSTLEDDHFFGYPVDAGVGCFMDIDAAGAMAQREAQHADDPHFNYYDSVLDEELDDDVADHYPLGPGSANNLVVFRSGWGDGSYPSYWGLDAKGDPVVLITDFMIIRDGDGRNDDDKRKDAYLATLTPEKLAALEALGAATDAGDEDAIRGILAAGLAGANEIVPSMGETAIWTAIRRDRREALRLLLDGKPCPAMPEELYMKSVETYLDFANFMRDPRDPTLVAMLK
jgi:hypothetical protein